MLHYLSALSCYRAHQTLNPTPDQRHPNTHARFVTKWLRGGNEALPVMTVTNGSTPNVYKSLLPCDMSSGYILWHCNVCGMQNFSSCFFTSTMTDSQKESSELNISHSTTNGRPAPPPPPKLSSYSPVKSKPLPSRTYSNDMNTLIVNFQSVKKNKEEPIANMIDSINPNIIMKHG